MEETNFRMSIKLPYPPIMSAMDKNRHQRHSKSSSSSSNYTALLTPTREKLYFGGSDTIYDESRSQFLGQQGKKEGIEEDMDSETRLNAEWGLRLERVLNLTPRPTPALLDDSPTIPALDDDVLLDDSPLLPPLSDDNLPPLLPSAVDLNDPFMALRPSSSKQPVTPPKAFKQIRPATPRRSSGKKLQTIPRNPIAVRLPFDDMNKEDSTVNKDPLQLGPVHRPSVPSIKSLARSNSRSSITTSNFGPIIPGRNSSRPKPPSIKLRSTSLKSPSPKPPVPSLPISIARPSTPTYTFPESPISYNKSLPTPPVRRPSVESIESALDPQSFLPKDSTTTAKGGEISSLITVIDTYVSHQLYNNRFAASSTATLGFNHQYHYKTIREIRSAPELRRTNQLEFESEMLEWRKIFSSSSSSSPNTGTIPSKTTGGTSRFTGSIRSRLYSVQSLGRRNTFTSKMSRTHSDDYVPPAQTTMGTNNKARKSVLSSEVFTPPSSSSRTTEFGGIEHIAQGSHSRKGQSKEVNIPSYDNPLVPHQNTIMSPAPISIRTRNGKVLSPDLVKDVRDECKLDDALREEALAAIREAESWDWPQVPERRRMIKFLGEEHEIPMDADWTSPVRHTNAQASSSSSHSSGGPLVSPEDHEEAKEGSPNAPSTFSHITAQDLSYGRPPKPSHEIARVLAKDIPSNSLGLSNSISSSSMETTPSSADTMIFTPSPSLLLNIPNSEHSASPRTPTFDTMLELENDVTPKAPVREGLGASIELPSPSQPKRQVQPTEKADEDEGDNIQGSDPVRPVKSERRNVRFNDQALTVTDGVESNEKKKKWYKAIKSPHIPF